MSGRRDDSLQEPIVLTLLFSEQVAIVLISSSAGCFPKVWKSLLWCVSLLNKVPPNECPQTTSDWEGRGWRGGLCCCLASSGWPATPLERESIQSFGRAYSKIKPGELIIHLHRKGRASWEMPDPQLVWSAFNKQVAQYPGSRPVGQLGGEGRAV